MKSSWTNSLKSIWNDSHMCFVHVWTHCKHIPGSDGQWCPRIDANSILDGSNGFIIREKMQIKSIWGLKMDEMRHLEPEIFHWMASESRPTRSIITRTAGSIWVWNCRTHWEDTERTQLVGAAWGQFANTGANSRCEQPGLHSWPDLHSIIWMDQSLTTTRTLQMYHC